MVINQPTKVLVVDDSAIVRAGFQEQLSRHRDIEVVGLAPDPFVGRDILMKRSPDVILLDIEMPRMDGLTFLRKIMQYKPTPVIIVSSVTPKGCRTAMACLAAGAFDVLCKPDAAYSIDNLGEDIVRRIRSIGQQGAANVVRKLTQKVKPVSEFKGIETTNKLIAVGSSAGGPETVKQLLSAMPRSSPGMVLVQHMGPQFLIQMAERLDKHSKMKVSLATDGASILPGHALLAPGDKHLLVERVGGRYAVRISDGDRVSGHKPAVDVMFQSVSECAGSNAMGVILTGMGADGADGMKAMRDAGSFNVAQDEETSIVFGMPARAIECGGVHEVLPLQDIPQRIADFGAGTARARDAA